MITDKACNTVYFSELIKGELPRDLKDEYEVDSFFSTFSNIEAILKENHIQVKFLQRTKDIWARDYMPIQVSENEFVQFRYEPWYLKGRKYEKIKTNPDHVTVKGLKKPKNVKINLDGGNVVRAEDAVIICDRIFQENPEWDQKKLVKKLEELFRVEVLLIPTLPKQDDLTGHADGYVRFIDKNRVLVGMPEKKSQSDDDFINILKKYDLECVEIPAFEDKASYFRHSAIGTYVNYLEIGHLIIFPIFEKKQKPGTDTDAQALKIIKKAFPDRTIVPANINPIAQHGGILNCITWTVKE